MCSLPDGASMKTDGYFMEKQLRCRFRGALLLSRAPVHQGDPHGTCLLERMSISRTVATKSRVSYALSAPTLIGPRRPRCRRLRHLRYSMALACIREMEAAEKAGRMVPVDQVDAAWSDIRAKIKGAVLRILVMEVRAGRATRSIQW
jgi:hypothetical protein